MRNIIINLQKSDSWKIQLTIATDFISSKDAEKDCVMHSRSSNLKFKSYNDVTEVVDEVFESLHSRCQGNLGTSVRKSNFLFDSVQLMYYKCHKILNLGDHILILQTWQKRKKPTTNPKNEDHKCSQYAVTVALNYGETELHPERVWNIKPYINNIYNWKRIKYPSKIDDWKKFQKTNPTIACDVLCIKEKDICPAYISKADSNCEKQIILLMVPNKEKKYDIIL